MKMKCSLGLKIGFAVFLLIMLVIIVFLVILSTKTNIEFHDPTKSMIDSDFKALEDILWKTKPFYNSRNMSEMVMNFVFNIINQWQQPTWIMKVKLVYLILL